jgi:hypothetical protein
MVACDLLAPDRIEQDDPLAVGVRRLTCEGFVLHGRSAWPLVRMRRHHRAVAAVVGLIAFG